MKKILLPILLFSITVSAQHSLVGIVSRQDTVKALQFGVVGTVANGQTRGVQLAGMSNMSVSSLRGIQLGGVSNLSTGVERGLQLSALLNVSSGYMHGLQFSAYNYADSLNGSQVGLINVARTHPKGWQVGLVNITHDTIAHKMGLVNVNPNTKIDFMLYGGSTTKLNLAARFRNRSTYNIIGVGTHYMGLDEKFSGALFYRIGQYFQLSPRWSASGDIGFYHIETFEHNNANKPERLFSMQARLNADFQLNERIGLFASVGFAETRYYHHARHYRSRPLFELGLTMRHWREKVRQNAAESTIPTPLQTDSLMAFPQEKRPWMAAAEATGINVLVHCFDRFVMNEDFAKTTLRSIRRNFEYGFVWDNDQFSTNLFAHPYHGNLYYNAARSNGLSFWESAPYALGGSLMWEFMGETEPAAINDLAATTIGGIAIGEVTHRVSNLLLNDRDSGFSRFLREAAATVINPVKGFNRIVSGQAWRLRNDHHLYHDHSQFPVDCSISAGDRYLADNGALFRGEHNPYVNLYLSYGDPLNEDGNNKPYDFFEFETTFGLSKNQPLVNSLHLLGRIWSTPMFTDKEMRSEFGIYQHFNYYDSKPVKEGSDLTPYRISEAASVGPGIIFSFPELGALRRMEQRIFLSGILLGGTKSDYYNIIDRDYNMGSGFSVKSKTHLEMRHFGRFILHAKYFRLFTWKGYEQKDLSIVNPLYLNSQGDKGNASLFVITPLVEVDLKGSWSLLFASSYFSRVTRYKYFDNVRAKTFELKAGLTYHF